MSKSFFFGLCTVYDWEYLWGRTAAQIDLRTIDQPIIVYKSDKRDKPWKDGYVDESYSSRQYRKWLEKKHQRERDGVSTNVSDVFASASRVDMQDFLSRGDESVGE